MYEGGAAWHFFFSFFCILSPCSGQPSALKWKLIKEQVGQEKKKKKKGGGTTHLAKYDEMRMNVNADVVDLPELFFVEYIERSFSYSLGILETSFTPLKCFS